MKRLLLLLVAFEIAATAQSQVSLLSNNTNLDRGFVINGKAVVLSASDSLWTTDGTPAGTYKLVNNVKVADSGMTILNNVVYFTGITAGTGAELWKSDGTAAGTVMIKDLCPGSTGSGPSDFAVYNNKVYFIANDGVRGFELWTTDGTPDGTVILKDIYTGAGSGVLLSPYFTPANGFLYFVGNDGTHGTELWKTDGTTPGTMMVADITSGAQSTHFYWNPFAILNNLVLFSTINEADFSLKIWKTDGTSDGTIMFADFGTNSGFLTYYFGEDAYYTFNNKVYFTTRAGSDLGGKLWVTDGSISGTTHVKDLNAELWHAVTINNKFYFPAYTPSQGWDFWMSDGTPAGTTPLIEFFPGDASFLIYTLPPYDIATYNHGQLFHGKFFFITYHYNIPHYELQLWISDGTTAGTTKVKDMNSGGSMGVYHWFSHYYSAEGLYFSDDNGLGVEPWFTDGTTAGTKSVADINPGTGPSDPRYLFIYNNQLYLAANDGDNTSGYRDLFKLSANATPLPVILLQFTATREPDAIQLQWTVTAQGTMDRYEVERSIDGITFVTIGSVTAESGASADHSYGFADREAIKLNQPAVFYRLRLVDSDGAYKYSDTVKVDLPITVLTLSLTPNPAGATTLLTITGIFQGKTVIEIIDPSGRIVRQLVKDVNTTVTKVPLDVRGLAPGTYLLRVTSDNNTQVLQFVKQ